MNARIIPRCLRSPLLGSAALGLTLLAAAASCHPAAGGDSEFWAPLPGAGGAPGSSAAGLGDLDDAALLQWLSPAPLRE